MSHLFYCMKNGISRSEVEEIVKIVIEEDPFGKNNAEVATIASRIE